MEKMEYSTRGLSCVFQSWPSRYLVWHFAVVVIKSSSRVVSTPSRSRRLLCGMEPQSCSSRPPRVLLVTPREQVRFLCGIAYHGSGNTLSALVSGSSTTCAFHFVPEFACPSKCLCVCSLCYLCDVVRFFGCGLWPLIVRS